MRIDNSSSAELVCKKIIRSEVHMEFISLKKKIDEAGRHKLRIVQLFGTDNFRSWMLYFEPGDGTPMHYHQSPETFLVVDGKCSVKSIEGHEKVLEKNDIVFLPAK